MSGLKRIVAAAAAAMAVSALAVPAEANWRCGYDRYGYHPPGHGCFRNKTWGFYPAYGFYPSGYTYGFPRHEDYAYSVYPEYPIYPVGSGCQYDNGYDMRVHVVCPRR